MGSALAVLSKPGVERRQFERFELLAQVELRMRGEVVVLPIVNISAGGVLLSVEDDQLPGVGIDEQVSVFLDVDEMPFSINMDATVVRVIPGESKGIALMWTSSNPNEVAKLARLLAYVRARQHD